MPNHIHIIFVLKDNAPAGASPRPTLKDIVCAYKSLAARECKKLTAVQKLFQNSFYDHVIRDERDFEEKYNYILANPSRWCDDELYCDAIK